MIARRLATIVVAAAMIVGAFLIRRNVIEGDEGDDDPSPPPAEEVSGLVCLTELEDVCTELRASHPDLDIIVEDAWVTLDRLAAGDPPPLWLTFEPFPTMAGTLEAGDVLAASELAISTPAGRQDVLAADCATAPIWRCIGDAADDPWEEIGGEESWGVVEPSVGNAGRSAAALASLAVAVAGYLGTAEYTSANWSTDPAFAPWVSRLVRAVPVTQLSGGTPAATMVTRPAVNIAATSDAEITSLGASIERFESSYPEPSMWLQAVLAAPAGTDVPEGLAQDAQATLRAQGWDPPDIASQPLPSANTMIALRQLWEEIQ